MDDRPNFKANERFCSKGAVRNSSNRESNSLWRYCSNISSGDAELVFLQEIPCQDVEEALLQ
jgi:hypothetical protein